MLSQAMTSHSNTYYTITEAKLHSGTGTWNAKSHEMYNSKIFCGSIKKHGMWAKNHFMV